VPDGDSLGAWAEHLTETGIDHAGVVLENGHPHFSCVIPMASPSSWWHPDRSRAPMDGRNRRTHQRAAPARWRPPWRTAGRCRVRTSSIPRTPGWRHLCRAPWTRARFRHTPSGAATVPRGRRRMS
jgi:hypothetical protein